MKRRDFLTALVAAPAATIALSAAGIANAPRTHAIRITDFAFVPATLTVKPGDRIRWINDDIAPHTATADDRSWDTQQLTRGKSGEIVVAADMKRTYFCRFHPVMKGELIIES